MNTLDLLLKCNTADFVAPTQEVHIPELDEILGETAKIKIKAISLDKLEHLRTIHQDKADFHIMLVVEGCCDPDLKNPGLLEKFKVATPIDLVKKLFLAGTTEELYLKISALSGYGRDTVEEIKNN